MTWWVVLRPTGPDGEVEVIDEVPYDSDCDREYVRRGLIEHDGYPSDVIVVTAAEWQKKRRGERAKIEKG